MAQAERGSRCHDPRPLTRGLVPLLALHVVLAWALLGGLVLLVERLWLRVAGYAQPGFLLADHVAQLDTLRLIQAALWVVTAVAFLAWVRRGYVSLAALGAPEPGYTPGWASAAFVVPVLNLLHAVTVIAGLWRGAAASAGRPESAGRASLWAGSWWGLLVAAFVLDPVPLRPLQGVLERLDLPGGFLSLVLAGVAEMAAGVLGIVLVLRISAAQREAASRAGGEVDRRR